VTTTNHADTIRDILAGAGYQGSFYKGPPASQTDDRAVFIYPGDSDGSPRYTFNSDETENRDLYRVRCRGPADDYQVAEEDSRLIKDALATNTDQASYLDVRRLRGPSYIQTDDEDRHEFSFDILCWIIE